MKKPVFYGLLSAIFFAFTFVLNSSINLYGGSFIWSASLRYIFMLPILYIILIKNNKVKAVHLGIIKNIKPWILWSTIGFGFFYAPLTFASNYGQSWLVAGCWQITIVCGILLTPLFNKKIPVKNLLMSFIIIFGVFLIQYEQATSISLSGALLSIIPIIIAAFSYPLGNRKMMEICKDELDTFQRIYGMTLCSLPFWIILSIFGVIKDGLPGSNQIFQSFIVAIFSGVIATYLFFKATDMVKDNATELAIVESTQSGEVIFAILGEILILKGSVPNKMGLLGLFLIILGMILNSIISSKEKETKKDLIKDNLFS
jgi:drug/metabolite transporter (DMT)-like permease